MTLSQLEAAIQTFAESALSSLNAAQVQSRVAVINADTPHAPTITRIGMHADGFTVEQMLAAVDRQARTRAAYAAFPPAACFGMIIIVTKSLAASAEEGWITLDLKWASLEITA